MFEELEKMLIGQGLDIISCSKDRPWGGFFLIEEKQVQNFANLYFDGLDIKTLKITERLSPKILLVQPSKRLSWQYHNRRAEIWCVVKGTVGIVRSKTDE
jgi:mannose-6-phosphate isomerase